jgi:hypothetical protein
VKDTGIDGSPYQNGSQDKRVRRCGLDSPGAGWGLLASSCEYGNEPSVP